MAGENGAAAMTVIADDIGGLHNFDVKENPNSNSQRWKKWRRAFELYFFYIPLDWMFKKSTSH